MGAVARKAQEVNTTLIIMIAGLFLLGLLLVLFFSLRDRVIP